MSADLYLNIELAVVDALKNESYFGLQFSLPDKPLANPPGDSLWGELFVNNGAQTIVAIGDCAGRENVGFYQINVCSPENQGSGSVLAKVGEIALFFTENPIILYNGESIRIYEIFPGQRFYSGGFYKVPLTINYRVRSAS